MIDIKTIRSTIKQVENNPDRLLRNSIECFEEMSKEGFLSLTAGKDEKGNVRVFAPVWSAVFFIICSIPLFINIILSGASVYLNLTWKWIYKVLSLFCAVLCLTVSLPIVYLTLGRISRKNTLTKFGMKITKAK
ncbi:hypothetical protein JC221_227 [Yersinia phage JC221]|nr:hypothetical protein JC221_227 [Yersinia phage JC221]